MTERPNTQHTTPHGISVVVCSYNNASFLERCISSILAQDVQPLQIIILDDASTDNTQDVLAPYHGRTGFTLLKNDHNLGLTKSLKIAVAAAHHPLIARIDADDVMLPGRLSYQAQLLADDTIILSGSGAILDYEDEGIILTPAGKDQFFNADDPFLSNPFAHSSVTFKKSAYDAAGGYNDHFAKCQDFDLWKTMKDHGRLHLSSHNLTKRSIHDGMITRKSALAQFRYTQEIRFRNIAMRHVFPAFSKMAKDALFIAIPRFVKRMFIWKKHTDQIIANIKAKAQPNAVKPLMLHLCTSMQIGGAQIALASMVKNPHYTASYRSCVVAFGESSTLIPTITADGTPIANFRVNSLFSAAIAYLCLRRIIKHTQPQSLYSWLYHTHFLSIITKLNFRKLNIIWAVHSWKREFLSSRTNTILSLCARASRWVPRHIIYASEASRDVHHDYGFDARKAVVIENGTRLVTPEPQNMSVHESAQLDSLQGKIVIGTVSRFVIEKDIDTFIAMATRLKDRHPNAHFVMIGAGLSSENTILCQALVNAGIRDAVTLINVSSDLGTWLARMDVFCLSSKSESFPLVIGEAILAGTIPVSTDVGGIRKIIPQGKITTAQLIAPTGDPLALANSVSQVITMADDDKAACLDILQHHINTQFSEDQCVAKHLALFAR